MRQHPAGAGSRATSPASNAFDGDAVIAWFAGDALVNDRREFWGKDAIRAWLDREIIGDKVTTTPTANPPSTTGEVIVHAVTDRRVRQDPAADPLCLHLLLHRPRPPHRAAESSSATSRRRRGLSIEGHTSRKDWRCR